ncbi:hypothetical protein M8J76_000693 [Diaphorina citri]|nr:hypothetical protein M8J75_007458 [Diaphorina citri]KAI5744269.1 hypothetical protein M8J76_000693 [Diaphorina citri]
MRGEIQISYYSSSSDSDNDCDTSNHQTSAQLSTGSQHQKTPKQKLPLPNELLERFQAPNQVMDNPNEHGGRIRSFPHQRNSWATLVYIPLQTNLTRLYAMLKEELNSVGISVEVIPEPHLSLSKTLVIPYHWIEPLVETLGNNLRHLNRLTIKFNSIEIFCNEEKTRSFIALGANSCKTSLTSIVQAVDKSAQEFKLPTYYEEPNFHASIAWCLQDKTATLKPLLTKLDNIFTQFKLTSDESFHVDVTHIHMKTGNKFYSFPLT